MKPSLPSSGAPMIHSHAICESTKIGSGTRIWAFAHVLAGADVGSDCNICDHVFIENDVKVGDQVTLKCGVQLWDGIELGNRVFVGPNATFTNDRHPRSKAYPEQFLRTIVEDDVSIGANATILPGIRIGRGAMIGAGAVVTRDVPPYATLVGNPAVIVGYRDSAENTKMAAASVPMSDIATMPVGTRKPVGIGCAFLERLPGFVDLRGSLTPLELNRGLPFSPKRVFMVYNVPNSRVRGEHAHFVCEQFLVAIGGAVSVVLDDGHDRAEVRLDNPGTGLYLPKMTWGTQYKFTANAILMVLASHEYDGADYIRDYEQFLTLVKK